MKKFQPMATKKTHRELVLFDTQQASKQGFFFTGWVVATIIP